MSNNEIKRSICMWCHNHCRVAVHLEDGRLVKVTEDEAHPHAQSYRPVVRSCQRAINAPDWFYHPDRLTYPLKRAGERGQNKWDKIPWEQALDEIASRLNDIKDRYGPEAITSSAGTSRTHDEYRTRFFNLLGSPNVVGQGTICFGSTNMVSSIVLGWPANHTGTRPGVTQGILVIGGNPPMGENRLWFNMLACINKGAKLIVIDPRRSETAERADIWLQLRPGTDAALLMGMINVIIQEELFDAEFVAKWCHGFEQLKVRAAEYSLDKVSSITWVPADKIREAARLYASCKPATTFSMMGIEHIHNSMEALHARFILPALTGNVDVKGGDIMRPAHTGVVSIYDIEMNEAVTREQNLKMLGSSRFPLMTWPGYEAIVANQKRVYGRPIGRATCCLAHGPTAYRAILNGKEPYPVKAMITLSSNPLVTQANTKLVYKALKALDFYVVMDFWKTPCAELADYVLPAASWLERPELWQFEDTAGFVDVGEAAFPAVVEGKYNRSTDFDFWRGLAVRMGQEKHWPWKTLEESYDYRLAPIGHTLKSFIKEKNGYDAPHTTEKKYETVGFATNTGKVELYSTVLEKMGFDPLPHFDEPMESPVRTPELAKEYPLILITGGRFMPMYHSEHRQIDSLRRQHPDPVIQLNPATAAKLGIADGDWAWIETPRGRVRQKCRLFDGIDPRVVHAQHGWWLPELPGEEPWLHGVWESNINVCTDDDPDHCNQSGGGWALRALLCKVYKVKSY
ncbi:MAG: molybdopterin-dependent oxidoreductase [Dehalococcoidia bacterium]|nr:molybdopterin-dependent oxidoreductase [Dehalococcoidia bacterium]